MLRLLPFLAFIASTYFSTVFAQFEGQLVLPERSAVFGEASNNQYAVALEVDEENNTWLLSRLQTGAQGRSEALVQRFDDTGTTTLEVALDGTGDTHLRPLSITPAAAGGCYVTALQVTSVTSSFLESSSGDLYLWYVSGDGSAQPRTLLRADTDAEGAALLEHQNGRLALGILAGSEARFDYSLLRLDGSLLVERSYSGTTSGNSSATPQPVQALLLPGGEAVFGLQLGDRDALYAFDAAGNLTRGAPVISGGFSTGINDLLHIGGGEVLVANAFFDNTSGNISPQLHRFGPAGELTSFDFSDITIQSFPPVLQLAKRTGGFYLIYQSGVNFNYLRLDNNLTGSVLEPTVVTNEFFQNNALYTVDAAGNLFYATEARKDLQKGVTLRRIAALSGADWERDLRTGGAGGEENGRRIIRRPGGGYVVAGTRGGAGTDMDAWLLFLDRDGVLLRENALPFAGFNEVVDLYADTDDRFYLLTRGQSQNLLQAFSFSGDPVWETNIPNAPFSFFDKRVIYPSINDNRLLLSGRRGDVYEIDRRSGELRTQYPIGTFEQTYAGYFPLRATGPDYLAMVGIRFENGVNDYELILLELDGRLRNRLSLTEAMGENLLDIEYLAASADRVHVVARGNDDTTPFGFSEVLLYDVENNEISEQYRLNAPLLGNLKTTRLANGHTLMWRGGSLIDYRDEQLQLTGRYLIPLNIADIVPAPGGAWAAVGTVPGRGGSDLGWQLIAPSGRQSLFRLTAQPDLTVYPNPTTGLVNFTLNNAYQGTVDWSLHYLDGRRLSAGTVEKLDTVLAQRVDLANSVSGVYLLRIRYGEETVTRRVVVR